MDLSGPIHDFLLVFLVSSLILGGVGVVLLPNPIYFAFSLGFILVCTSLFYILSNSHFVADAQLLIYVWATNVLIIFAVMFMNGSEYRKGFHLWTVGNGVATMVCTSIVVLLIIIIPDTSCYGIIWTTKSNRQWILEQDLTSYQRIMINLSTDFCLLFELISIILLVALIGVIELARQ